MKTILTAVTLVAALAPFAGSAETSASQEAALMAGAKVTMSQAGDLALKAHPGTLAEVGFNDENGKGIYEAHITDGSGQAYTVKIDAMSGEVLASGQATQMDANEQDGERNDAQAEAGGSDGEAADDNSSSGN